MIAGLFDRTARIVTNYTFDTKRCPLHAEKVKLALTINGKRVSLLSIPVGYLCWTCSMITFNLDKMKKAGCDFRARGALYGPCRRAQDIIASHLR